MCYRQRSTFDVSPWDPSALFPDRFFPVDLCSSAWLSWLLGRPSDPPFSIFPALGLETYQNIQLFI